MTGAVMLAVAALVAIATPLSGQCPDGSPPPCARAGATRPVTSYSVAVLYFDNLSHDTANSYLAEGLTEELIVRLSQVRRLEVKSRFESQRVRGAVQDPRALGRDMRTAYLVSGGLQRAGDRVRLNVSLVRTSSGAQVWANIYDRSGADILQIQSDIATEVTRAITGQLLPAEQASLARRPTSDPVAYDFYLRGVGAANTLSESGLRAGLALFDRAIARDSSFADAWAQEAVVWLMLSDSWIEGREGYAKVRAAAERAIRLDSAQALAWSMLVFPAVVLDFDSAAGLRAGNRAVRVDDRLPLAHSTLGQAYLMAGRLDDAVREARRGWRADTLFAIPALAYLHTMLIAHQADSMAALLPRMQLALAPEDIREWEGWVHLMRGDAAAAAARFEWPWFGGWFGGERVRALVDLGRTTEARATQDSMLAEAARGYFNPYVIAKGYAALGNTDSAFVWLDRAREQRTHWLIALPWDPMLTSLHSGPRFAALLRSVGRAP